MKVCVQGIWHLGAVIAACLADNGHNVVGLDFGYETITNLQAGKPPLYEPGLEDLIRRGIKEQRLSFTIDIARALEGTEVVWVAYDTPVDDEDRADVDFVIESVKRIYPYLRNDMLVMVSSQLPVGSTHLLEKSFAQSCPGVKVSFAYSPENLRLGKAISIFTRPDRVVAGVRTEEDRIRIEMLLKPFVDRIEWMTIESAEMTKHALNAFLALSVTFANEIATLCEQVGADAKEVERGLKSEERIGPKAYLAPGTAFAGGTLARDIEFLTQIGASCGLPTHLLRSVKTSNDEHRLWVRRRLNSLLGPLPGQRVAIWGLTYKPGTDTLRRSASVELAIWLTGEGVHVTAHDPAVKKLPDELAKNITLCDTPLAAVAGASALVVSTEWPEYIQEKADDLVSAMRKPIVIDPKRYLFAVLRNERRIHYAAVGYFSKKGVGLDL